MSKQKKDVYVLIGASNHSSKKRVDNDYYATPSFIVKKLLEVEKFNNKILEPCCGEGLVSKELEANGYEVVSSDVVDRGFGVVKDLFEYKEFDGDIVTNPPYCIATDVTKHLLSLLKPGHKLAQFLKLTFLETASRYENIFKLKMLKNVYVCTKRVGCGNPKDFKKDKDGNLNCGSAVCYAWFVWEKGYNGYPELKWINT